MELGKGRHDWKRETMKRNERWWWRESVSLRVKRRRKSTGGGGVKREGERGEIGLGLGFVWKDDNRGVCQVAHEEGVVYADL